MKLQALLLVTNKVEPIIGLLTKDLSSASKHLSAFLSSTRQSPFNLVAYTNGEICLLVVLPIGEEVPASGIDPSVPRLLYLEEHNPLLLTHALGGSSSTHSYGDRLNPNFYVSIGFS